MKHNKNRNRGSILVTVSLSMVALVGVVGLAIDGGNIYVQRRQMQNSADAGAYAGAYLMAQGNTNDSAILAQATDYASRNGVANSTTNVRVWYTKLGQKVGVELPGNTNAPTDADGIEVTATTKFPTYFMGILGVSRSNAQGTAGARATPPTAGSSGSSVAVFAGNTNNKEAIKTTGPNYIMNGLIHSNSGITNSGGGYQVNGDVEYVTSASVDKWTINSSTNGPVQSTVKPYPVNYQASDFAPGGAEALKASPQYYYISGDLTLSGIVPAGLYYVKGNVSGSSKFTANNVTIVTEGTISISSPESQLSAFTQNIGMFTTAVGKAIHISSGGSSSWRGLLYAPKGAIDFSMPKGTMVGGLIADTINITGPDANITGAPVGPNQAGSPGQVFLYN